MKKVITMTLLTASISACGTIGNAPGKMLEHVRNQDYEAAEKIVAAQDYYKEERNALLRFVDKGSVAYLKENYKVALENFTNAKAIADKLYTRSVSEVVAAQFAGEGLVSYSGQKYELSLLRFFIGLTNYQLSMLEPDNRTYSDAVKGSSQEWYEFLNNAKERHIDLMQETWESVVDKRDSKRIYASMQSILDEAYINYPSFKAGFDKKLKNYIATNDKNSNTTIVLKQGLIQPKFAKKEFFGFDFIEDTILSGFDKSIAEVEKKTHQKFSPEDIKALRENVSKTLSERQSLLKDLSYEIVSMKKPPLAKPYTIEITKKKSKEAKEKDMILISPVSEVAYRQFKITEPTRSKVKRTRVAIKYVVPFVGAVVSSAYSPILFPSVFKKGVELVNKTEYADLRSWGALPENIFIQQEKLDAGEYTLVLKNDKKESVYTTSFEVKAEAPTLVDITLPHI